MKFEDCDFVDRSFFPASLGERDWLNVGVREGGRRRNGMRVREWLKGKEGWVCARGKVNWEGGGMYVCDDGVVGQGLRLLVRILFIFYVGTEDKKEME